MRKKLVSLFLIFVLLTSTTACQPAPKIHTEQFFDLFDTFSAFTCYNLSDEDFTMVKDGLYNLLLTFHQETDIYHAYEGMVNLKTLNDAAGKTGLTLSSRLVDFLCFCKDAYEISEGKVNVMLGSVTRLWHNAREEKKLPEEEVLKEASLHTDITLLEVNRENNTAMITDPEASIDVGALAKGYAGHLAAQFLETMGIDNFLLSLGGNIIAHGKPVGTGRDHFVIGLQDPNGEEGSYRDTIELTDGCVVTSGDYQRYFEVDGVRYHHIIDPETLYPACYHHSVTVICDDSGIADLYSTMFFLTEGELTQQQSEYYHVTVIYEGQVK